MKRFQHILCYIPHNTSDELVLRWCGKIAEFANTKSVDLIICYEDFQASDEEWDVFSTEETDRISGIAKRFLTGTNFETIILKDPPAKGMLEQLSSGTYDLLVLPKETTYGISLVEKIARKSPVGVLVIPENAKPTFSSILLGVDFADLSPLALEWAEAFANIHLTSVDLNAIHVVNMPRHSRALQATDPHMLRSRLFDISANNLKGFIEKDSEDPSKWQQKIVEHPLAGIQLLKQARENKSDLIVIGSHGRHALSVALLGGQTSDLIRETEVPLLIAKRKNESLKFLKQLLGITS